MGACTTLSTLHGAHTTPKDERVLTIATGAVGAVDVTNVQSVGVLPTVAEVQYRQGLTDRLDFGVRLYLVGVMLDANWMIVEARDFAVSLNPAIGGYVSGGDPADQTSVLGGAWMSVLMDLAHSQRATLTIGARGGLLLASQKEWTGGGGTAEGTLVGGGMLGATQRLSWRVSLLEEASVYTIGNGVILFNASLGLVWNE